jgi:hypothetical protein
MDRVSWNDEPGMIVRCIERISGVILAVYIMFASDRGCIFGCWVPDASEVSLVGLGHTAGIMVGCVLFLTYGIRRLHFAVGIRRRG